MGLQEAYQERMEAQVREWQAEIAKLKARADIERSQAKIEYYKRMEAMHRRLTGANPIADFLDRLRDKLNT